MRKIVVSMSVSLDGYVAGPGGDLGWHLVDDELHRHFNEMLGAMSAFLEGRVVYELMEAFWPAADTDPASPAPMIEFARIWRETPKLVYSRTLDDADLGPNASLVRDVVPDEVRALQALPGGDMSLGGADLAAAFRAHDLVDVYRLYVHPVVLGAGTLLFAPSGPGADLRLVATRTFATGVVMLEHERVRTPVGRA